MGRALGAPGFSSIVWSHNRAGGNSCEAVSLKTWVYFRYGVGTLGVSSFGLLKMIHPISRVLVGDILGRLMVRGRN